MKSAIAFLIIFIIIFGASNLAHASEIKKTKNNIWPMFMHDAKHTAQSQFDTSNTYGGIIWSLEIGYHVSIPVIANDGTIYIGSRGELGEFFLNAIYPNGTIKWKIQIGGEWLGFAWSSPAIADDGTIYIGSRDGYLNAVYPNGTLKWTIRLGNSLKTPTIDKHGIIYVISYYEEEKKTYLHAIYPNGTIKWKIQIGGESLGFAWNSPAIADDGTIYIGSGSFLYAIYPNGTIKWKFQTGGSIVSSPAIADDGTIYVGSEDGFLYAIYPNNALKWRKQLHNGIEMSPAISKDGIIYIGSGKWEYGQPNKEDYLYAFYPNSTLKWKLDLYGVISINPVIGYDGTIFVTTSKNYLYAIYPNGTIKWKLKFEDMLYSPIIGSNNIIYISSYNKLYAVGRTAPAPPRNLVISSTDGYVNLSWDPPIHNGGSEILEYRIYRGVSSGEAIRIAIVPADQLWFNDTEVSLGMTYYYYVTAVNKFGESEASNKISVTVGQPIPEIPSELFTWLLILIVLYIGYKNK